MTITEQNSPIGREITFSWATELSARIAGEPSPAGLTDAELVALATEWSTCSTAECTGMNFTDEHSETFDYQLIGLGVSFCCYVTELDWEQALVTLRDITDTVQLCSP